MVKPKLSPLSISGLFFLLLLSGPSAGAYSSEENAAPRKTIRVEAPSSINRDELSSRFAFLSQRLASMPELPRIERLDEMASPPSVQGKEISFGATRNRKAAD